MAIFSSPYTHLTTIWHFKLNKYQTDRSKEPIVEMRTEDERITNHEDGSPVNEPNETTPLTEPEYVARSAYL